MESANIIVIGAGVVGLAVAAKISEKNEGVYLFEKNPRYGQETSSHNSCVIHSGIHYQKTLSKQYSALRAIGCFTSCAASAGYLSKGWVS